MVGDKEASSIAEEITRPSVRNWTSIVLALAVALPSPILRTLDITGIYHLHWPHLLQSAIFGVGILAAATLLVWTSEVAEKLISATLALALLAIIAVLPEYAVDLYFAWTAPTNPENAHLSIANMTGANRLLVGLAWPVVFYLFWYTQRRVGTKNVELAVGEQNSVGLIFLGAATLYSFTIAARGHLSLIDTGVLVSLFVVYLYLSSRAPPAEDIPVVGPALAIDSLPIRWRWGAIIALFAYAAGTVFAAAEPFAHGLTETGENYGVSEFLLVQWVAPLASEAPEFILAALLALRMRAQAGLSILLSSKVNQWTLLVGTLPLVYAISDGSFSPLSFDDRQVEEVFLTAAQSLFAVAILVSLSLTFWEATLMLGLFTGQLFFPQSEVRWGFAIMYLVLSARWLIFERRFVPALFRHARDEIGKPGGHGAHHAISEGGG
jgi:cation:H+ antiporter